MEAKFDRSRFLKFGAAVAALPLVAKIPAPAYAEGSHAPVVLEPALDGPNMVLFGFANAIVGYERTYPFLAEAVKGWVKRGKPMAINTVALWNTKRDLVARFNYQQIVRNLYGVSDPATMGGVVRKLRQEKLHEHLQAVENTIRHGQRWERRQEYDSRGFLVAPPLRTCGGVDTFPTGGELCLYPLRDLVLLRNRQGELSDTYKEEWLSEFTLKVYG